MKKFFSRYIIFKILLSFIVFLSSKMILTKNDMPISQDNEIRAESQFTTKLNLNSNDAKKIGMQIWENEASGKKDLLTFWSLYESFPSLGIGHFIWMPYNIEHRYVEQFPLLCEYMKTCGIILPKWLDRAIIIGAPWTSREEFLADKEKINELRELLASTVDVQTNFIIQRFLQQAPTIINASPNEQKEKISRIIDLMLTSLNGTYALVDYLNFKGSGIAKNEQILGQGWGLLQVLMDMPEDLYAENACKAFSLSCAKILLRRIQNSAPEYNPIRFMHGWIKRVSTYFNPEIFEK